MDPSKYRANTITRYRLTEENLIGKVVEPVEHYDLLSIVMICLGGPEQANYSGILRMLDVLLSRETSETEKKAVPKVVLKVVLKAVLMVSYLPSRISWKHWA